MPNRRTKFIVWYECLNRFQKYTAANKCASIYGVTTEGIRQQNRTKRIKKEPSVYNSLERTCLRVYMMTLIRSVCSEAKSGLQIKK